MFESIPPSILRYIASFTYPISATVCKAWTRHLSISAIQEDFGLETVECYTHHIAKRITGLRTKQAIVSADCLNCLSHEVKNIKLSHVRDGAVDQIKNFTKLEKLVIHSKIHRVPEIFEFRYLKFLSLYVFDNIKNLSQIGKIKTIETLHLQFDHDHDDYDHDNDYDSDDDEIVTDLSFVRFHEHLENLKITRHPDLDISHFRHNKKLKNLELHFCYLDGLDEDVFGKYFTSLQYLSLHNTNITTLQVLRKLVELKSLELWNNPIHDISHIRYFVNLEVLKFKVLENIRIVAIDCLEYLVQLQHLQLDGFRDVLNISHLQRLVQLKSLELLRFTSVTDISPIRDLSRLEKLTISHINVSDISCVGGLENLKILDIEYCSNVEDISFLRGLNKLKDLYLNDLVNVRDIDAIGELSQLECLTLDNCNHIHDLSSVARLPNLYYLDISCCPKIRDVSCLRNVKKLVISNRPNIQITTIKNLVQLESLYLYRMDTMDISPIAGITGLASLLVREFPNVTDASCLQSLTQLQYLHIQNFPRITDVSWINHMKQLNTIELFYLPRVTNRPDEFNAYIKDIYMN
jgi:Leucine-rich repeat (LRR) protein